MVVDYFINQHSPTFPLGYMVSDTVLFDGLKLHRGFLALT